MTHTFTMNRISTFTVVIFTILACACTGGKTKDANAENTIALLEEEQTRTLPEGAIPFDLANHLYFDIVLYDSIPARMIFDTGNTNILIETQFFKKHFAPSDNLQRAVIQGAGNSLQAVYRDTSDWTYTIGEYRHTEQGAIVMDLRDILGSGVDGMFGMEFMRGRKVEFNYADEYMRILPQDAQPAESYTCVKCKWLDKRQTRMLLPMSVTIKDGVTFDGNFLIDLGARAGLALNSNLAAKQNLRNVLTNVRKKIYDVGGAGGSRTDYLFKAEGISLAGYDIKDFNAELSANSMGSMADDRYDGLIGNELLERFDVIFDFAKCEVWLRPNKNFNAASKYDSGMTLTPHTDCWVVNGLIEGGKAHRAGIVRGDSITSINGLTPEKLNIKNLKRLNASADKWRVCVKRGNTTSEITFDKEEL